jgi:hypothetical protein
LRLTSNTEILDTNAQVGLIGSSGTDNIVLSAQVTKDVGAVKGNADVGAQVVVAGLGSDNYITRVQGMTYDNAGHVIKQASAAAIALRVAAIAAATNASRMAASDPQNFVKIALATETVTAAATAAFTSCLSANATLPVTAPLAGLVTGCER